LSNRGNVLLELRRYEEALASHGRALAITPDHAGALNNRGNALLELRRHEEAAKDFEGLLTVEPDWDYAQGNMLHSQLYCVDWKDYSRNVELTVRTSPPASVPLTRLHFSRYPDRPVTNRNARGHSAETDMPRQRTRCGRASVINMIGFVSLTCRPIFTVTPSLI